MGPIFKKILPHLLSTVILLLISVVFFLPQLEGEKVRQGDVINYIGMAKESQDFRQETGKRTLWTNSMFGGMPTYQITTVRAGNQLQHLDRLFRLFGGGDQPIGRFFTAMIGFYILLMVLGMNPWLGVAGAVAFGLTTNSVILFEAGHMTKIRSVAYFPLIAAGMLLVFRKSYLWGGLLFAIGLGLNLYSNHIQMTYYFFLTLIIFGIAQLVDSLRKKEMPHFWRSAATILAGTALALGTAASNLWVTYEYSKDTMRGEPILEKTGQVVESSSETDGLAWDYAMQWSNGVIDVFASFIPGVAGGGSGEKVGSGTPLYQDPNWQRITQANGSRAPLYWGSLISTSGPIYLGTIVFFLFLMGLTLIKGPVKWWLGLGVLLTFLLSMGKELAWFNELFFYYVPLYNKFRTPNSVLSIASFLMPLLGFLALHKVLQPETSREEIRKSLFLAGGISGAMFLFFLVLGPSMFDFSAPGDQRYQQAGFNLNPLVQTRQSLMRTDSLRGLVLTALAAGLIWLFIREKLQKSYLLAGIAILVLFDTWSIGRRYVDYDDFGPRSQALTLSPNPADQQILQDKDPNFRVFDSTDPYAFSSSRVSYFHKSIGGNHAAKLQRYMDLIDRHLSNSNMKVFNMLNTKYFIVQGQQGGAPAAQQNPGALGNAWFVDTLSFVPTANAEIDALNTFDPASQVVVHEEFKDYIGNFSPRKEGSIRLTNYQPNQLIYESNSTSEQLSVFSEIWYGPDKGWQAYIDGEPTDHIRVNYALRGMKIPAGQHTIEFRFDPKLYRSGALISNISSVFLLLSLLFGLGFSSYRFLEEARKTPPPPEKPVRPAKAKPTAAKRRKTVTTSTGSNKKGKKKKNSKK